MKTWLRPLPFALALAYAAVHIGRTPIDNAAPNRSAALCSALAHADVTCAAEDVLWIDGPSGVLGAITGSARAVVRGRAVRTEAEVAQAAKSPEAADGTTTSEALDLYLATARLSPEGAVLALGDVYNLTHTNDADEGMPVRKDSHVAYVAVVDGRPEAVHVLDLDGHPAHAYDDLSWLQKLQTKIADWQKTGQWRGVRRTVFALVEEPTHIDLAFRADGMLQVSMDKGARSIVIDPANETLVSGATYARVTPEVLAKPPTFAPWMSDRLRAASWFGDEKNQVLKAIVFTAEEWLKSWKSKVTGDTSAKDVAEDLAALNAGQPTPTTFTDPEIGWPPKPLEPMLKPPLAGEGRWISLDRDAFITPIPGLPSPFLTTFVRTDPAALYTRVYITLWDPRLVSLHMQAGTVEPVSATGETGPGQIPRVPEVMTHLVAGFNGGFQATHGQYGMQVDGVLYLPPKPYAATVMELRDGTTAFGAWPRNTEVPEEIFSFRQNMTALVQNDKYNPWGRTWWGGVPPGWHDAVHTTRSGLCLTKENFVAYFWGNDIGPEPLGRAMLAARCAFGIHLDMNPGLAGFEFYNVERANRFQPLRRSLQSDWEYEGSLKDMPDVKFRARRMVKSMGHILFPRYIHRDARDFFYLTTRPVLPGAPIGMPEGVSSEAAFRTKGLPQHGYPYAIAIAMAQLGPSPSDPRVRILRVDPRTVAPSDAGAPDSPVVVAFGRVASAPDHPPSPSSAHDPAAHNPIDRKLCLLPHAFAIDKACAAGSAVLADILAPSSPLAERARAAVGISDTDGMLQWIELLPEGPTQADRPAPKAPQTQDKASADTADAMLKLLERMGCGSRGLIAGNVRALLGGTLDIGGEPIGVASVGVRLVRTPAPGARTYFDSTALVPASVWAPLQAQRVKWRPTLAPPDKPAASASGAPPPPAPPR